MDVFQILNKSIFRERPIEAYSYWIKKRVLVFEQGNDIKIKLSVEEKEQAALVYCQDRDDLPSLYALFLYKHKDSHVSATVITGNTADLSQIAKWLKENLGQVSIKFIVLDTIAKSSDNILHVNTREYIGRNLENFIKE